ncbi:beta-ketoacyl synthase N-terminal-like domain-containing protein [Amycolatopsis cihanbeyliensis]|uniref:3-oxoacyl-[acyl-carrier-protein] synthase II n=1 Tax=Amycolatopsis cihanbeyliensis TaxID=1128664 RepID=A0A542DE77_AMYCI|nr:beta-ketoacyl synthase N-terminal-like domain-containing protein [Amycolatopsis cihanbeyliensis]TQJ01373.1 3-oxoacyl-[acyl-carrier-protein] synthase II [Amycolatopsis cihanbeyliensis]
MTARTAATNPVISNWSAVSPFGFGREAYVEGLCSGRDAVTDLDAEQWQVPVGRAGLVPGFDLRKVLGKKGTRSMDRVTGLAVATVGGLLNDVDGNRLIETGERTGLVLGTTTGSAQSMMDFTRDSLTADKPFYVDPARMPNAVMNCAAGQCAIWHQLKGPNTTIAGGRTAGLFALKYAGRLLATGRAGEVLCAGAEEYSHARAWLEHHSRGEEAAGTVLGEGGAVLLVEPPSPAGHGRQPLAEILAVESRVYLEGDLRIVLDACVRGALDRSGLAARDAWAVVPSGPPGAAGRYESEVLGELFEAPALRRVPDLSRLGDTSGASATFQLVSVLSVAERATEASGEAAVVTSVDPDGTVACAVLRLLGGNR